MPKNIGDNNKVTLRKKYFDLRNSPKKGEDFFLLKKDKWSFLLPSDDEQEILIKKFKFLLSSKDFRFYLDSPVIHSESCVYVTEVREGSINIYVTAEYLLPELREEMKERAADEAISFLVLKGKYEYQNQLYELRIGAYGVPCYKLTKAIIG